MSGICGIVHFDDRPADEVGLGAMVDAGRHRAVDGVARWVEGGCAMAQLISDPDLDAPQPSQHVRSQDGRFVVVGDVHLHDRETLRSALGSLTSLIPGELGDPPSSDLDLLLASYLRWGPDCVAHLIGDYAFAIWDRVDRRLFAARDPMGMRPLFYRSDGHRLTFASEIGQVLASGGVPRRLFRPMAAAWLAVQAGDPTWTFLDGVHQVPGAHGLTVTGTGARLARCWDVDAGRRIVYRSDDAYVDHFKELLLTATRARLARARPSGMLLSGGLDSCAVAGAAGWLLNGDPSLADGHPFTTFAYRYEGFPQCDERHISEPLARHWGMRIEEISSDAWHAGDLLGGRWDVDGPAVGIYRPLQDAAMERARSLGIRQLFIAARGDNMVGGYIWDVAGLLLSGSVTEAFRELGRYRGAHGLDLSRGVHRTFLNAAAFAVMARSRRLADLRARRNARVLERRLAQGSLAESWVSEALLREVDLRTVFGASDRPRFTNRAAQARYDTVFDRFTELGNLQNERRAATYGLRIEDPWSDRRILEFVCAVPQHALNRVGDTKRLARRALTGLVPPAVQAAARKIIPAPFGVDALRVREAQSLSALSSGMRAAQAGLIDEPALAAHIKDFLAGAEFKSGAWSAVALEAWLRFNDIEA
jgi:asparagine synthase (glutamine-hydrolysing)